MTDNNPYPSPKLDLTKLTKEELMALANSLPRPIEVYDGTKNTLFGWEGEGVWVLPASKENFDRFERIAKTKPDMGHDSNEVHCEIMKEAGAGFFEDWRESWRARDAREVW